jgi:hypothetical protein
MTSGSEAARFTYRTERIAGEELIYLELGRLATERGAMARFARRAGVTSAMMSRVIHGDTPLTPRIAWALGALEEGDKRRAGQMMLTNFRNGIELGKREAHGAILAQSAPRGTA